MVNQSENALFNNHSNKMLENEVILRVIFREINLGMGVLLNEMESEGFNGVREMLAPVGIEGSGAGIYYSEESLKCIDLPMSSYEVEHVMKMEI